MRCHYASGRSDEIKNTSNKGWRGCGENGDLSGRAYKERCSESSLPTPWGLNRALFYDLNSIPKYKPCPQELKQSSSQQRHSSEPEVT